MFKYITLPFINVSIVKSTFNENVSGVKGIYFSTSIVGKEIFRPILYL